MDPCELNQNNGKSGLTLVFILDISLQNVPLLSN